MYVATAANTTGATALPSNIDLAIPGAATQAALLRSVGLLGVGDVVGNSAPLARTAQTAVLTSSGTLALYSFLPTTSAAINDASKNNVAAFSVTGGTITSVSGTTGVAGTGYNSTLTAAGVVIPSPTTSISTGLASVLVKPNAGVTSMIVNFYAAPIATYTSGSGVANDIAAAAAASPSSGNLLGSITVNISNVSVSGTVSQTKSAIYYSGATESSARSADITTAISGYAAVGTSAYNQAQYAQIRARDAYSVGLPSGVVSASVTTGGTVAVGTTTTAPSAGTTTSAYTTAAPDALMFTVGSSVTTPTNVTLTVSYNGVVIGVKAFTFTGEVAKVTLSSPYNGQTAKSTTATGNIVTVAFYDAAGNSVYPTSGSTSYPQNLVKDANAVASSLVSLGTVTYPTSAAGGNAAYSCGSLPATGVMIVDYTNQSGSVIVSNSANISCSGNAASYTAALDKSKYAPGDIATLKVTFKDSTGALAADILSSYLGSWSAAITGGIASNSAIPSITGSQLTPVIAGASTATAGSAIDATTNGVATYKFIVGTTSGSYQVIVDFPAVDAVAGTSQTVAYSVADGSTSLNDVLKGIVSLIASINKQIAALAKLVTKK
jgi:hypothetical protein